MDGERIEFPRGLLFDMDGTITRPMLDFARIRAEMGITSGPMLAALAKMSAAERAVAEEVLLRHEKKAAGESELNSGCETLFEWIGEREIPVALITNNSRASLTTVMERHQLSFHVMITREDGAFKPDPSPLLSACAQLKTAPEQVWMIGDGQYDVEAGNAAGIRTVWISHHAPRPFAAEPWKTVGHLGELLEILRELARD